VAPGQKPKPQRPGIKASNSLSEFIYLNILWLSETESNIGIKPSDGTVEERVLMSRQRGSYAE